MKLEELLQFNQIVIQCHDNPDADAIASGYSLFAYLKTHGKQVRLIYGGRQPIRKSNLILMVETLDIPIEYVQNLEEEPELLLTVDCQYGEKNVQQFPARTVAVIDHHKARLEKLPAMREVRDNYGACATVVWDMLCAEGFDVGADEGLSTALYYGLFMDTSKLQELRHPKDKDLRDAIEFRCNKGSLFLFQNCNLSLDELRIAGQALADYDYYPDNHFAIVEAQQCDPNILGIISDMLIEVDSVYTCIVYCMLDGGAKLSVRSCVRETRADELAAYVAEGLGSGGGHIRKSGGFLREDLLILAYENLHGPLDPALFSSGVHRLLAERMKRYFEEQDLIHTGSEDVPNLSREPIYQKNRLPIGYVRATDLYPAGTKVEVRMLEGDIPFTIKEDTYFMIGVDSEVYKNDEAYFLLHNDPTDIPYQFQGEYAPTVHETVSVIGLEEEGKPRKNLKDFAKTCIPKDTSFIHARQITRRTKIFVPWSDSYLLGIPGDWLVSRTENPGDVYIVRKEIFMKTYTLVDEKKYQIDTEENKAFLKDVRENLLAFGHRFPSPQGGSYYLGDDGTPWKERDRETWITCRMAHVYSIGSFLGHAGSEELVDAALKGLKGELHDQKNGGWYPGVTAEGTILADKQCYAHAFVLLAASSAMLAGRAGAKELLEEALNLFDLRFWNEEEGLTADTWNTEFTVLDDYRGLNANMHTVEAFLAVADATGREMYRTRAGRIIDHVISWAADNQWRIPEHFTKEWKAELEYNKECPADPFKPYGATPGHGIEWARLITQWALSVHKDDRQALKPYIEASENLYQRAVEDAWAKDGGPGLAYTTDWEGNPVIHDRMHWTLAEAINTSAVLYHVTDNERYAADYAQFMEYLDGQVLDHVNGSWFHQMDEKGNVTGSVWPGKSDLYHAFQATLIPYCKPEISIASAIYRS